MKNDKKLIIKLSLIIIYLILILILFVSAFTIYKDSNRIHQFNKVKNTTNYSYINISKMSEKFAYYKDKNIGLHFVVEEEVTGKWHTYIIAINEDDIKKYKDIIDYTYGRVKNIPKKIKVTGYPILINEDLKNIAIKNIRGFLPEENEVVITSENFNSYLTNCYLDSTKKELKGFNLLLMIILLMMLFIIFLLILAITDYSVIKKYNNIIKK